MYCCCCCYNDLWFKDIPRAMMCKIINLVQTQTQGPILNLSRRPPLYRLFIIEWSLPLAHTFSGVTYTSQMVGFLSERSSQTELRCFVEHGPESPSKWTAGNYQLISTRGCCASWVENSGELAPIPLLKIHARIKWSLFVYNVPTDEF